MIELWCEIKLMWGGMGGDKGGARGGASTNAALDERFRLLPDQVAVFPAEPAGCVCVPVSGYSGQFLSLQRCCR